MPRQPSSQDSMTVREAVGRVPLAKHFPELSLHMPLRSSCSWASRALSRTYSEVACPSPPLGPASDLRGGDQPFQSTNSSWGWPGRSGELEALEEWRGRRCYVGKGQVQIAVETVSLKKKKKKFPSLLSCVFLPQSSLCGRLRQRVRASGSEQLLAPPSAAGLGPLSGEGQERPGREPVVHAPAEALETASLPSADPTCLPLYCPRRNARPP